MIEEELERIAGQTRTRGNDAAELGKHGRKSGHPFGHKPQKWKAALRSIKSAQSRRRNIARLGAVVALAFFATEIRAQAPGLADPVTIKVTRQQLLVIGQGLQELPAKLANPILNDLQAQLNAADKEAADKAGADKAPPDTPKKP